MSTKALSLTDSILKITGIGPSTYFNFEKKNIRTVQDLLLYYPIGYDDYSKIVPLNQTRAGDACTVDGELKSIQTSFSKSSRITIQKGILTSATGSIDLVWFNQPFLLNSLKKGQRYLISGKIDFFAGRKVLKPESLELYTTKPLHTARIVPRYSAVHGVSDRLIRGKIDYILKEMPQVNIFDSLPIDIRTKERLLSKTDVIRLLHQPQNHEQVTRALYRMQFDSLLELTIQQKIIRNRINAFDSYICKSNASEILNFKSLAFPFVFTAAQEKALSEILTDMGNPHPMNRLLLGDVGSGKTAVFSTAAFIALQNNKKVIILAPTEILLQQHFEVLQKVFGQTNYKVQVLSSKEKAKDITNADILITTHAILYKNNLPKNVGLIIIDEQHRFGVNQRFELIKKTTEGNITPHVLTVSATPIPRSLALVLHGSLDLSIIDELPKGRIPTVTKLVTDSVRAKAYEWLETRISSVGMQIFVVCPLIDDSETDRGAELKSVSSTLEELRKAFPRHAIEGIHSKMKNQLEIIERFRNREIDILIATTVVEVGVDIPNATCMIVENADRFGLAQLHQLRGRVGRSSQQSYCLLFSGNHSEIAQRRLKAMTELSNGFKLAELDLEIRGPGALLGTIQHGFDAELLPHLFNAALLKRISEIADLLLAKNGESSYTTTVPLYLN